MSFNELVNGLTQLNLTLSASNSQASPFFPVHQPHVPNSHQSTAAHTSQAVNNSTFPRCNGNVAQSYHGLAVTHPSSQSHTSSLMSSQLDLVSQESSQSHDQQDDSDSDEETTLSHPNKFPVEIEHHDNRFCSYKRQPNR